MKISNFAMNLRGPWMITPEQAAAMAPVLRGVVQGYITELGTAPEPRMAAVPCAASGIGSDKTRDSQKFVFVTYLSGTMLKYDSCDAPGTRSIGERMLRMDEDPSVIGHMIVADSGGGSVDSVPELRDAILKCTKPVVGFIDGTAASACIYALSYCDRILAHQPTDRVGCIGTLIQLSGYPKFTKDPDGYVTARIYADGATEKNADFEAALEGNFQVIREQTLNPLNERFVADMKANRPNTPDSQLTGRTYFASEVIGTLIDAIATFDEAIESVARLAADQENTNAENSNNMENNVQTNYPSLASLPGFKDLVIDQADGTTTLQAVQLQEIEDALAGGIRDASAVQALSAELQQERETAARREERIAELETSLAAAIERAENPSPEQPAPTKTPESGEEEVKAASNFSEAMEACKEFLNR